MALRWACLIVAGFGLLLCLVGQRAGVIVVAAVQVAVIIIKLREDTPGGTR